MRNSSASGPILLIEPSAQRLQAALQRHSGRDILCVSGKPDHLARLREQAGAAEGIVFFLGGIAAVLREFPLFWAEIRLDGATGAAELADSLAEEGGLDWRAPDAAAAVAVATGLVERGTYAGFEATAEGVRLRASAATPPRIAWAAIPGWRDLGTLLDAAFESQIEGAAGSAIRPFRQVWLRPSDRALGGGWPFRPEDAIVLPPTLPDGRPWPRISIVTASFNQSLYIEETLLSVRRQNYPNLEHIVVDGGSTDGTLAILERYRAGLTHLVVEPDRGQSHAINKGMALATGEILAWLNSDDMLAPGALAAAALGFATSGADLVAGICRIHRDGAVVAEHLTSCEDGPLPLDDLLDLDGGWNAGQFFYQPEVLFTRALWDKAGGRVEESLRFGMDYELWLRFAEQGGRLHVLGRPIAWFRLHDQQKTVDVAAFKAELAEFRAFYLERTGYRPRRGRPAPDHGRRLRVALVNDIGWQYGAGIAQRRLAEAIERAGHSAVSIALTSEALPAGEAGALTSDALESRLAEARPDLVIFGNIHGARIEPVALAPILARWPSLVVMHDLWWLTGRCIYNGTCEKYLTGCDATCPTPEEYPALAPDKIGRAWQDKRLLYAGPTAPVLLANSDWAAQRARSALQGGAPPIERFRLGFPLDIFRPRDRRACRERLGLPLDRFIVAVSATALLEPRKGAAQLRDVILRTELPSLLFVTIGHGDIGALEVPEGRLLALGPVNEPERLAEIYAAADVLISPSTEETFGQVFVEAAACGTPVIGHGVTGVAEAVRDGVTGFLTAVPNADGLDAALLELYCRPARRDALAVWGRFHCENTWSYAACYHSLFAALRRTGLADRLKLPHKITFVPGEAPKAPARGADSILWQAGPGIGPVEGPYPEHGMRRAFQWCSGPESRFELSAGLAGRHLLVVEYQNIYFETIGLELRRGATVLGRAALEQTTGARSALAWFRVDLDAGRQDLAFHFDRWREPDAGEARPLAMMLCALELVRL